MTWGKKLTIKDGEEQFIEIAEVKSLHGTNLPIGGEIEFDLTWLPIPHEYEFLFTELQPHILAMSLGETSKLRVQYDDEMFQAEYKLIYVREEKPAHAIWEFVKLIDDV